MSRRQEDREENRGRYTFENPIVAVGDKGPCFCPSDCCGLWPCAIPKPRYRIYFDRHAHYAYGFKLPFSAGFNWSSSPCDFFINLRGGYFECTQLGRQALTLEKGVTSQESPEPPTPFWEPGRAQVCLSPDCDCESLCPGQCLC